jgi:hypothetical protein
LASFFWSPVSFAEELAGARLGDGAQVSDHLVAAHADAVVGDGQGPGGRSKPMRILKSESPSNSPAVVEGLEAQLVAGVGGVGNQLAQEDLAVGVQRVDHQVKQLLDLGLEAE